MMMMNSISRRVWLASVVVLGLSASTAWALTAYQDQFVPGLDGSGNLDNGLGANITLKVVVNTSKGTFVATGKGKVTNNFLVYDKKKMQAKLEGKTFVNPPLTVPVPPGVTVNSVNYEVKKNGQCSLEAAGTVM